MNLKQPISFHPLFKERIWGGRQLETLLKIPLPASAPIGETWNVVDRPEEQSLVASGPLQGMSLHDLWKNYRAEVFGKSYLKSSISRFPLLCKILDASQTLSLQVHPPVHQAALLSGEPKTECWYILHADPGAFIYAGVQCGTTKEKFYKALHEGTAEHLLHRIPVQAGDSMFIPSGRLHAIGKGIVIVEIQQNSDTTYRVFDWNRCDAEGKQRALHIEESIASIDFNDDEPKLISQGSEVIVASPYFQIEKWSLEKPRHALQVAESDQARFAIFTCLTGRIRCEDQTYSPGAFFLVPASTRVSSLIPLEQGTTVLKTTLPEQ